MSQPTPPRGEAPEKLARLIAESCYCVPEMDEPCTACEAQALLAEYEAHAEERIAEARAEAFNRAATFAGHYFSQDGADPAVFKIKLRRMAEAARSEKP